jgi:hypothetical protein
MSVVRMRVTFSAVVAIVAAFLAATAQPVPTVAPETRPWTRWWWMGSAVDEAGITAELEALKDAGIGGVEITPIYGAAGREARFVPYLSDRWTGLLEHTLREARRLGLGVDMATGTGWPFGGPWVGEQDASRGLAYRKWTFEGGRRVVVSVHLDQQPMRRTIGSPATIEQVREARRLPLQTLVGYLDSGGTIDLTNRVDAEGTLDWNAPPGNWTLYAVFLAWHGKFVERAAPGGEGAVIDHFSREAIRRYLEHFDGRFAGRTVTGLRAFFNDSYEVDDADGQADDTPLLFDEFERRRGYDLRQHLPALLGEVHPESDARVVADYRLTVSDLLLDTFTTEWRAWAQRRGAIVRNQAHGSPANLLDLYAASDIPETEGSEIIRAKWASSAAHVAGRRLVSAETATWLGEHFQSTLADVRAAIDLFLIAGVNHIVYHGTAYSPRSEPWPGWQFYASVEFNPRNPWWNDLRAVNEYVTRAQTALQTGIADHDVLLYYPFYDAIASDARPRLAHFGGANPPAEGTAFERATTILQQRGFTYDFISDRQLLTSRASNGEILTGGGATYKLLVVPASRFMPIETLEQIVSLARRGARIVAFDGVPRDGAGFGNLAANQTRFRAAVDAARRLIAQGDDLERLLNDGGVAREPVVDRGLQFARRRSGSGRSYFIANLSEQDIDGWIPLADDRTTATILDPMTGQRGQAEARRAGNRTLEVHLSIPRHESIIVSTQPGPSADPRWIRADASGTPLSIGGPWRLQFTAGGPEIPRESTMASLASWTTLGDEAAKRFSGTVMYTTTFVKPELDASAWLLDLGIVRESARVRLNGRDIATLIGPAFRVTIDPRQLDNSNVLEIAVTNLMANRIAAMDKAGMRWRIFYNINFPSRLPENRGADGLFTAAAWPPRESGLLGPVTLTPATRR